MGIGKWEMRRFRFGGAGRRVKKVKLKVEVKVLRKGQCRDEAGREGREGKKGNNVM